MVKRIFLLLLFPFCVSAQSWEFSEIKALDENNINSDGEEVFPLLSPDGKTLYFSRVFYSGNQGGKYSGADIWVSTFDERQKIWSRPIAATKINDKGTNAVVGVGQDGKTVYIMKTNASGKPDGIYVTKKSGTVWEKPSSLSVPALDPAGFLGFYMSPDN